MILANCEKVHVLHRRNREHEPHRHFMGEVEDYQGGVVRVIGHLYPVDREQGGFIRRPELRVRRIPIVAGDTFVNVIPEAVDLEQISDHQEKKAIRVTDGSEWHLDLSKVAWL